MSIFPRLGTVYYDEQHRPLLEQMEANYAESITINQSFWAEADTDTRVDAGFQDMWTDISGNVPANLSRRYYFNLARRNRLMIEGHQRRNRKSIICVPIENGDSDTADQFTKLIMWNNQREGVLETISDAFGGALVTGLNLLQVWLDFRSDPVSGDIKVDKCSYNEFMIDPYFRKHDLSDCNFIWKRSFLTKEAAMSYLPAFAEKIGAITVAGSNRDGKFQFMPESYAYGSRKLLTYDEYWYRDYRTQRMLSDSQTGETMEWVSDDEDALKRYLALYPQVTVFNQEVPTVRLGIVVEGRVMYDGPHPYGIDRYPFIPVFAYYNPQMPYFPWRIQGIIRGIRDAQYLFNRRKIIELDMMESQINSGWKYKENALVDPRDVFKSGQGRGLAIKSDASMDDAQQIVPPAISPSVMQLSENLGSLMQDILGVSEELLGFDNKDTLSGYHAMLKMSASTTTLQTLFDNLDRSQKLLGKLFIEIIQANFTPGKVKRIIEEEPSAQFYHKAFGKYDAAVEDGVNTTTQRQMQFAQLMYMKESGIQIPDDLILDATTVQNKSKLMESVRQRSEMQRQLQNLQLQSEIQALQARAKRDEAKAVADTGLGIERASRVEENRALAVERTAQAKRDRDAGLLNLVKALKEIDEVDIHQIEKLLSLAELVKGQETEVSASPQTPTPTPPPTQPIPQSAGISALEQLQTGGSQETL